MAAFVVEHQDCIAFLTLEEVLHLRKQHPVLALVAGTQLSICVLGGLVVRHPVTDPFAARIVVSPHDADASALKHIEQPFSAFGQAVLVLILADVQEHARQRNCGSGTARAHVREADDITLLQLRICIAGVAIEGEVGGACGFPHGQYQQFGLASRSLSVHHCIGTDGCQRFRRGHLAFQVAMTGRKQVCGNQNEPDLSIVTQQGCV